MDLSALRTPSYLSWITILRQPSHFFAQVPLTLFLLGWH